MLMSLGPPGLEVPAASLAHRLAALFECGTNGMNPLWEVGIEHNWTGIGLSPSPQTAGGVTMLPRFTGSVAYCGPQHST